MQRALISILATGLLLSGCIIYETEHIRDRDCIGCEDTGLNLGDDDDDDINIGDDDDDDPNPDDTVPDEPALPNFTLTVTEGEPGDVLLCWIEADETFDFTLIDTVTFVGDISVEDTVIDSDEAMLLLQVDPNATPGTVQVFVEFTDGEAALLDTPFTINESQEGGGGGGGCAPGELDTGCP